MNLQWRVCLENCQQWCDLYTICDKHVGNTFIKLQAALLIDRIPLLQDSCRIPAQWSSRLSFLVHPGAVRWQHYSVQRCISCPPLSPLRPQQQVSPSYTLIAQCTVASNYRSYVILGPRSLNVDMEWLYGSSESSNMEVDIGYLPQV